MEIPTTDVLLVTVTQIEAETLLTLFEEKYNHKPEPIQGDKISYHDLGYIEGAKTLMIRTEMGSGGPSGSALTIHEAIEEVSPSTVIMVGIAFGIDPEKQKIGDILVSRQLSGYDLNRVSTSKEGGIKIIPRADRPSASPRILDKFRASEIIWQGPRLKFGLMLSGQSLIDNKEYKTQLVALEPEAIGGEMEGYGLYSAATRNNVDWIVVKAICDWADGNKQKNKKENQKLAAKNAAEFVLFVLEQGGFKKFTTSDLLAICQESLRLYAHEQKFFTNPETWIDREKPLSPDHNLHFLVSEAGLGKTVHAHHLLQQHFDSGGFGIWLPARYIADSLTLENAVNKFLQEIYSTLETDFAKEIKNLLPVSNKFMIVIDDINRTEHPAQSAKTILQWIKPVQFSKDVTDPQINEPVIPKSPWKIVCPIWPSVMKSVELTTMVQPNWIHKIFLGYLTFQEADAAFQKGDFPSLNRTTSSQLAINLNFDPFLIGLAVAKSLETSQENIDSLADDILESFIKGKIKDVVSINLDKGFVPSDFRKALSDVAATMLNERNLNPSWPQIREWFQSDQNTIDALWELSRNEELCRISEEEIFRFRHDRLFESFAVDYFIVVLNNPSESELLFEPYFAEIIGKALSQYQGIDKHRLQQIGEKSLLVLFEAIQAFGDPSTDDHHTIIQEAMKCVQKYRYDGDVEFAYIRNNILWSLLKTDSSVVLDLTENINNDFIYQMRSLARLKNGELASGIVHCDIFGLAPSFSVVDAYGDVWRDVIYHVRQVHKEKFIPSLQEMCASPSAPITNPQGRGDWILAGHLGFPELSKHIVAGWQAQADQRHCLATAILACIRCYSPDHDEFLSPLIHYWAELPDILDEASRVAKQKTVSENSFILLSYGLSDEAIQYLLEVSKKYPPLRSVIARMLVREDNPITIEFIIRSADASLKEYKIKEHDEPLHWISEFLDLWKGYYRSGYEFSTPTISKLEHLWQSEKNNNQVRKWALRFWIESNQPEMLKTLKEIPTDSVLFQEALVNRLRLADQSVVPDLPNLLKSNPVWFHYANLVWCDDLVEVTNFHLDSFKETIPQDFSGGRLNEHYDLSKFLMKIPSYNAESLLIENWGHLRFSPRFILVALYLGTPKCLSLVDEVLVEVLPEIDVFDRIITSLQLSGIKITLDFLENIKPYLSRLNMDEVHSLARACSQLGNTGLDWIRINLAPFLDEEITYYLAPTLEDHIGRLDIYAKKRSSGHWVNEWFEKLDNLEGNHDPFDLLEKWLMKEVSYQRYRLIAVCIAMKGSRVHLPILENTTVPNAEVYGLDRIKENTIFAVKRRSLD